MPDDEFSQPTLMASAAVSVCGTWADPAKRREQVLAAWESAFGAPPGLLAAAADAIAGLPKPFPDDVDEIERMAMIRKMVGLISPEEDLIIMIEARELLQDLAREFG